jgi:hypothetical protein
MMILLPGNVRQFKNAVIRNRTRWGWLITPRRSTRGILETIGGNWAADNECYVLGDKFKPDRYIAFLESYIDHAESCLYATAQDKLADAVATLEMLPYWSSVIRSLGFPVALVGQDGMEDLPVPWSLFDALFIGGSTDWKLGEGARRLIAEAKDRGKWVHVGRVNSATRLEYCIKLSVDSVDGTEWAINPGRGMRWAGHVMERMSKQKELPLCFM